MIAKGKSEKVDLSGILTKLQKDQGLNIGGLRDAIKPVIAFSTGNLVIDHLTGVGGFPRGRFTELYAPTGAGKTSLAVQSAGVAQNGFISSGSDNKILFLDFEHTMLLDYAANLGVNPDHCDSGGVPSFIISQPHYMEQGFETAMKLVGSGQVKMIIMDSVAEMTTTEDVEGEFAQRTGAPNRARKLKAMLLALKGLISEQDCACIFINHFNMSIPMGWGEKPKEQNPGGVSLPFHSSLRLKLIPGKRIVSVLEDPITKQKIKTVTAVESTATTTKNKMNYGYRSASVRIELGKGFSNTWSALQVLGAYGQVSKVGTSYYFNARGWDNLMHEDMPRLGVTNRPGLQGDRAALKFAEEHLEWKSLIIKTAEDDLQTGTSVYSSVGDGDEDGYGDVENQEVLDVTEDPE